MDVSQPILVTDSTPGLEQILSSLVYLHAHCILYDHTLATFLPPLSHGTMLAWWRTQLAEVTATNRHIVVQLMPVGSRSANIAPPTFSDVPADTLAPVVVVPSEGGNTSYEVAGVVSLCKPVTQTGPMRGLLEKLFTSPNHRRKGIARSVVRKLEEMAKLDGRWNVMLDTTVGSPAENVYPRLNYDKVGYVKNYGYSPKDGSLVDEVWFQKDLRTSKPL